MSSLLAYKEVNVRDSEKHIVMEMVAKRIVKFITNSAFIKRYPLPYRMDTAWNAAIPQNAAYVQNTARPREIVIPRKFA